MSLIPKLVFLSNSIINQQQLIQENVEEIKHFKVHYQMSKPAKSH